MNILQKQYEQLINAAKFRNLPDQLYREVHHVVPVSMGGRDDADNLVELTAEEHFRAHYLLWKIYGNREMTYAFHMMCTIERDGIKHTINEAEYAKLKEDNRHYRSEAMSGSIGNNLGKILPDEWRENISKSLIGNKRAVGNTSFKGKTHTDEAKKKISEKRKGVPTRAGIPFTQEVKDKMSADRQGKSKIPWTEERKVARAEMMRQLWTKRKSSD